MCQRLNLIGGKFSNLKKIHLLSFLLSVLINTAYKEETTKVTQSATCKAKLIIACLIKLHKIKK